MENASPVKITRFAAEEWSHPAIPDDLPQELVERARQVRRKGLADGEEGFFASYVTMPPGQVVDPHSHDHGELVIVVEGGMRFEAGDRVEQLRPKDSVVISPRTVYGFEVGDEGVHFLLIRTAKARSTLEPTSA